MNKIIGFIIVSIVVAVMATSFNQQTGSNTAAPAAPTVVSDPVAVSDNKEEEQAVAPQVIERIVVVKSSENELLLDRVSILIAGWFVILFITGIFSTYVGLEWWRVWLEHRRQVLQLEVERDIALAGSKPRPLIINKRGNDNRPNARVGEFLERVFEFGFAVNKWVEAGWQKEEIEGILDRLQEHGLISPRSQGSPAHWVDENPMNRVRLARALGV